MLNYQRVVLKSIKDVQIGHWLSQQGWFRQRLRDWRRLTNSFRGHDSQLLLKFDAKSVDFNEPSSQFLILCANVGFWGDSQISVTPQKDRIIKSHNRGFLSHRGTPNSHPAIKNGFPMKSTIQRSWGTPIDGNPQIVRNHIFLSFEGYCT